VVSGQAEVVATPVAGTAVGSEGPLLRMGIAMGSGIVKAILFILRTSIGKDALRYSCILTLLAQFVDCAINIF
jgi:hypothetical protein